MRFLVVEDEPDISELIVYNLEREGFLVEAAISGEEGLIKARADHPDPIVLDSMLKRTMAMVQGSADALVASDPALAWKVCEDDEEVDRIHENAYGKVQKEICAHPEQVKYYVSLLSVSRNLKRIADHATNIAEDVIYMVEGEIVRHSGGKGEPHG